MANKVEIEISAKATGFAAEFQKITAGAQQAGAKVKNAFAGLQTAGAALGAGLGAAGFALYLKNVSDTAEALLDLSDSTGSSVESLSRLSNIVKVGGGSFEEIQRAIEKLAPALAGTEEATSATAAALKFLNVESKDPAKALEEIAIKLNKFADGAQKAALMRDLFGKMGVGFSAAMKDIATKGDIAATVTTRQAEETTKLAEAYRRLRVDSTNVADAFYNSVVPALDTVMSRMSAAIKLSGGFWKGLALMAETPPWEETADAIARVTKNIAELEKTAKDPGFNLFGMTFGAGNSVNIQANLEKQKKVLELLQKEQLIRFGGPPTNERVDKPQPNYKTPKGLDEGKTKADEFTRALQNVAKAAAEADLELQGAFSDKEITGAQKALAALTSSDAWQKFTGAQRADLTARYEAIDVTERQTTAFKKQAEQLEKNSKALEESQKDQAATRQKFLESVGDYARENENIAQEIALIGADDVARMKLAETIRYEALQREGLLALSTEGLARLKAEYNERIRLIDEMAAATKRFAEIQQYNSIFVNAFADGLTDIVTGTKSVKEAFKSMEKSIVDSISRIAAQNLAEKLFGKGGFDIGSIMQKMFSGEGGASGGFDFGAILQKLIGSIFGGGAGSLQLGGFAAGGFPTPGKWAIVGENGPELIRPRGSTEVIPNHALGRGRTTVNNFYTTVERGASTESVRQTHDMLRAAVIKSQRG